MYLQNHKVNPANDKLGIAVSGAPGAGGAHHLYTVTGFSTRSNESADPKNSYVGLDILFQNGPISEVGVNGLTQEALLAIIEHRLECFQAGPYACRENALALTKVQEAMHWLHHRTRARMSRGVEGTHKK